MELLNGRTSDEQTEYKLLWCVPCPYKPVQAQAQALAQALPLKTASILSDKKVLILVESTRKLYYLMTVL